VRGQFTVSSGVRFALEYWEESSWPRPKRESVKLRQVDAAVDGVRARREGSTTARKRDEYIVVEMELLGFKRFVRA